MPIHNANEMADIQKPHSFKELKYVIEKQINEGIESYFDKHPEEIMQELRDNEVSPTEYGNYIEDKKRRLFTQVRREAWEKFQILSREIVACREPHVVSETNAEHSKKRKLNSPEDDKLIDSDDAGPADSKQSGPSPKP